MRHHKSLLHSILRHFTLAGLESGFPYVRCRPHGRSRRSGAAGRNHGWRRRWVRMTTGTGYAQMGTVWTTVAREMRAALGRLLPFGAIRASGWPWHDLCQSRELECRKDQILPAERCMWRPGPLGPEQELARASVQASIPRPVGRICGRLSHEILPEPVQIACDRPRWCAASGTRAWD